MSEEGKWCSAHLDWDFCHEPGPFDRVPAAPELAIYEAPTEKTLIGNPPPAPTIDDGAPIEPSEEGAIPAQLVEQDTAPIVAYEEIATVIDAAAAPPDPVFEAQKATLAAVFEAALAEGVAAGVCNRILFSAVKKLGIAPKSHPQVQK